MNLYPTRATFHVAVAGAAMVAVGVAARASVIVAFGGAVVLAILVSVLPGRYAARTPTALVLRAE